MHHQDILPGEIRAARVAAAFYEWLCDHGEILIATAGTLGGSDGEARARAVVASVTRGAEALEHLEDLRALRDLISNYVSGSLPAVYGDGDLVVECDPDAPQVVDAQICANALDCAIEALQSIKRGKVLRGRAGGHA
ncbi:hypothetical protein [Amaricoccus macauensis]|uniref:hypothetical protein n=1 Tax=Amaricoccus macauensis TaxID=57001 RepID=UPI003C7E3A07